MAENKQCFFDEHAPGWEERCYPDDIRERLLPLVESFGIRHGECVLDIGTGTGVLHPLLLDAVGASGKVLAFDLSLAMVKESKKKLLSENLSSFQASAMNIPLCDRACDRVICFAAFPHFDDKQAALFEMARISQKGGQIFIAHLHSREELAKHHASASVVKDDLLPDSDQMMRMFKDAGCLCRTIQNEPGLYLAEAEVL